jgi:hypothetical protein
MNRQQPKNMSVKNEAIRPNYKIVVDQAEAAKINTGITNYKNDKFKEPRITQHRNLKDKVRKFYDDKEGQAVREKANGERLENLQNEKDDSKTQVLSQLVS